VPKRTPFDEDKWELYDTTVDWSQARDLSAEHPEKLAELQALFLEEARKNGALPIDDRDVAERIDAAKAGRRTGPTTRTVVLSPGDGRLRGSTVPSLVNASFEIAIDLEAQEGSEGVLIAQGGRQAGWSLYVEGGRLVYAYNYFGLDWTHLSSDHEIPAGRHAVGLRYRYDGGATGAGGEATFLLDGSPIGGGRLERSVPMGWGVPDMLNVGIDRGSPVTERYAGRDGFPYTGRIETVTIRAGDDVVEPGGEQQVRAAMATQ
jgi:arylsulfatase